ncbi:TadE/TadG family type IV pilus assembly protein [Sphingomonas sp. S2-65]|uniref:TadE/TadG family type IV pilus assembly protein n=1 Tax=Sphingomonas sp. S2-65 TaxID=2903960 RepID=UPI001F1B0681|nr:TadE/TadG family type IV pilus assembly protein [Sphingomonas sp. S2-65]UYY58922.1 pilus assembly protein [Sphingomonas sp. S2-65]
MLEFGLMLPLFLGFVLTGIEVGNYVLANNRTQRLAAMTADLVAQSGVGAISATEGEIYDLFSAIDLTAQPFDLRNHGRVVISSVRGTDLDGNGAVETRFVWQRFDGGYVAAQPVIGCMKTTPLATLPRTRMLPLNELMFHVQVTYDYQPVFSKVPFRWVNLDTAFTRTAMFRARSTQLDTPTPDPARFPPKSNCVTANGL